MKGVFNIAFRIITHNIRYAVSTPSPGEVAWNLRVPGIINELHFNTLYNPEAFICLQEVLHGQLVDVLNGLNRNHPYGMGSGSPPWAYIGVGRDDGEEGGEYSPIIYRPSIWKLEHAETVWLSETPHKPSKGWDAATIRILTIGRFQHRKSKVRVVTMNTHLDHRGSTSRLESAKLIVRQIKKQILKGSIPGLRLNDNHRYKEVLPVILAGDFNSEPTQEAYKVLTSDDSPVQDLQSLTADENLYGDNHTFTGFTDDEWPTKLDFLFVGPKGYDGGGLDWDVRSYAVLPNRFEAGIYISDHRAVVGDIVLSIPKTRRSFYPG
ncbi:endonuclease/exonuclease/phosphatase [Eremomyces bilateralis CBS 781.70]|uniref:Endonuclease/exonuclease/phosphatase n=1 Tax=Eremomyces bilateralis CBS 781.70 TaxID=1392243 RepID=A0A6G1FTC1_9PEZI|nr:endonuclease/exonuclease/phosphatase [Eremomyces bilateralis CBS 781.70]KAF1809013.1 endonuclease/exonuclease/phosphatase [Eremomyces bilateralis CBS 781.70]